MELELKHFIDAYKYKTPCSLSRLGIFNLDLEYPDSRYEDIGHINSINIRADGNISGELKLNNGILVDFDFNINEEHDLVLFYRPLSDLTKEITVSGETFVPIDKLEEIHKGIDIYQPLNLEYPIEINIQTEDYSQDIDLHDGYLIIQKLLEWHFDIFRLIHAGLAIDINTLNE